MTSRSSLRLIKAHALGNDFLLVAAADLVGVLDVQPLARRVCDRHRGIGADGLMIVDETATGARTKLFNADGSHAEVSGNGVRCVAAWLAGARRLAPGSELVIETSAGPKRLELRHIQASRLTFRADMGPPTDLHAVDLEAAGQTVRATVLRVGNPQCVVLGEPSAARLQTVAAALAVHPYFPEGTNVELVEVEAPGRLRILIWERGVGPTEASGTGACAAAVAAAFSGGASRVSDVISPGGLQRVEWTENTIWLTGWAEVVAGIDWYGE
jgi:diaminopimelate epimerase